MNLYAYVGNDPVNLSDPSGKAGVLAAAPAAAPICAGPQAAGCVIAAGGIVVVVGGYYGIRWLANNVFNESNDGEDDEGIFPKDDVGKIKGYPNPSDVGDDELDEAIDELKDSINQREEEQKRYDPGDPSGDDDEKRARERYRNHQDKIDQENDALSELERRRRLRELFESMNRR